MQADLFSLLSSAQHVITNVTTHSQELPLSLPSCLHLCSYSLLRSVQTEGDERHAHSSGSTRGGKFRIIGVLQFFHMVVGYYHHETRAKPTIHYRDLIQSMEPTCNCVNCRFILMIPM